MALAAVAAKPDLFHGLLQQRAARDFRQRTQNCQALLLELNPAPDFGGPQEALCTASTSCAPTHGNSVSFAKDSTLQTQQEPKEPQSDDAPICKEPEQKKTAACHQGSRFGIARHQLAAGVLLGPHSSRLSRDCKRSLIAFLAFATKKCAVPKSRVM